MGRRIAVMAGQTEFGPAASPWYLTAGIRIDQTHNPVAMPAVVVAQEAAP